MGGGGSYYDRDVTDRKYRSSSSGVSSTTERELSQSRVDPTFLPKDRKLTSTSRSPLAYIFDVTGSMGNLPKIIYDKWPGIVGQVVARGYLPDAQMSLAAVGDIVSDRAPLQVADFSALRNLDKHFKRVYFESGGGGQSVESYEVIAYYYAYLCTLSNAETPICLFTGDEGFRFQLFGEDLSEHFGGKHKDTTAQKVFADLRAKFKGNVFLIHRYYPGDNNRIEREWCGVLGNDRVILLPRGTDGDLAIGDITLGVYAIVSGARSLAQYLEDMRTRPLNLGEGVTYEPQSEARIQQVEEALKPLRNFKPVTIERVVSPRRIKKEPSGEESSSTQEKQGKSRKDWKL
ncbi:MAG: hypothetical protein HZA36_00090 [Parcubacteria group bacterium]|nr:hypothetical protein [Parcubacteria group bacterium]